MGKSNCCNSGDKEEIRESVRDAYAKIATKGGCCYGGTQAQIPLQSPEQLAKGIGYAEEDLEALPDGANMGLSCGNPTAIASLKPGETVLDLGSGGGFDVFIAAQKVGSSGKAIGVDMTPEMIAKARKNADLFKQRHGLANVEFRLGEIEHLPVADHSMDVVISNCVINLSPDKPQVWREMARVLKPGGRVAVSDLALLEPLPDAIKKSIEALVGCVAGAALISETEDMAKAAGFNNIRVESKKDYIDSMIQWNDPLFRTILDNLPRGKKLSDYVTSIDLYARKS